jgi:hypothetical protein
MELDRAADFVITRTFAGTCPDIGIFVRSEPRTAGPDMPYTTYGCPCPAWFDNGAKAPRAERGGHQPRPHAGRLRRTQAAAAQLARQPIAAALCRCLPEFGRYFSMPPTQMLTPILLGNHDCYGVGGQNG